MDTARLTKSFNHSLYQAKQTLEQLSATMKDKVVDIAQATLHLGQFLKEQFLSSTMFTFLFNRSCTSIPATTLKLSKLEQENKQLRATVTELSSLKQKTETLEEQLNKSQEGLMQLHEDWSTAQLKYKGEALQHHFSRENLQEAQKELKEKEKESKQLHEALLTLAVCTDAVCKKLSQAEAENDIYKDEIINAQKQMTKLRQEETRLKEFMGTAQQALQQAASVAESQGFSVKK